MSKDWLTLQPKDLRKVRENLVMDHVKKKLSDSSLFAQIYRPAADGMGADTVDYLVNYMGKFVAIECKRYGKTPTLRQHNYLCDTRRCGGIGLVVDPVRVYWPVGEKEINAGTSQIKLMSRKGVFTKETYPYDISEAEGFTGPELCTHLIMQAVRGAKR